MPAVVDSVQVLSLLTRVRATRVAAGEIAASRLYDIRAYKDVLAELAYLRTLTRRGTGGTIVTAMTQLVKGLAALHPSWRLDGDKFADRDRHHQAIRRRLRDLDAMGLLRWRIGVDVDGEDARTELELRPAPDVTDEELVAAAAQLQRWRRRYGPALNTGSSTGIRDVDARARPLSAGERQRRGIVRTRSRSRSRREASASNSAPHFVAPTTSENNLLALSANASGSRDVCGDRTGVTRAHASAGDGARSATRSTETASLTVEGPSALGESVGWDESALLERVAARQPVLDAIATQATSWAVEVASWTLDRGWPQRRLQEAWVVWRRGATYVAEWSAAAAGPLEDGDLQRLRHAARRIERHADTRPTGFPTGGLATLAHIAAVAAERDTKPLTLHYGIRALDQLSRSMRGCATATAADPRRLQRCADRARRRLEQPPASEPTYPFASRTSAAPRWPRWVALDDHGNPLLVDGVLVIRDEFNSPTGYEHQPCGSRRARPTRSTTRSCAPRICWPACGHP